MSSFSFSSLANEFIKSLIPIVRNVMEAIDLRKTSGKKIVQVLSKIKLDKNILIKKHLF